MYVRRYVSGRCNNYPWTYTSVMYRIVRTYYYILILLVLKGLGSRICWWVLLTKVF